MLHLSFTDLLYSIFGPPAATIFYLDRCAFPEPRAEQTDNLFKIKVLFKIKIISIFSQEHTMPMHIKL
jgi:hypothetical protein